MCFSTETADGPYIQSSLATATGAGYQHVGWTWDGGTDDDDVCGALSLILGPTWSGHISAVQLPVTGVSPVNM